MKVVVQRVSCAACEVDGEIVNEIDNGYLLLVGFTHDDTIETVRHMAKKIANLRVFEDEQGKLNINIKDKKYSILSISQFTLYGDVKKGNRPSFTSAMNPTRAEELYQAFNNILQTTHHIPTKSGMFGKHMNITLTNDGPVTILVEG